MSRLGEAPPWHVTGPVYIEDQPMGNTEKILQYYNGIWFLFFYLFKIPSLLCTCVIGGEHM